MKAEPLIRSETGYVRCEASEATHIRLNMPGPIPTRIIPVNKQGSWTWNRDTDCPTVHPSILTKSYCGNTVKHLCHSFVVDGNVQFLSDCTHQFAGQTVPLIEID